MIGLDSSAMIDFYRGEDSLKDVLFDLNEQAAINIISYLEVMHGLDFNDKKHKQEEEFYDIMAENLVNLDLDKIACKKSAEIKNQLKKEGRTIDPFDMAIAAIYIVNGIDRIITRNVKHFENIKGIEVLKY